MANYEIWTNTVEAFLLKPKDINPHENDPDWYCKMQYPAEDDTTAQTICTDINLLECFIPE
jgi:hypothetical protein